ncbi:MAG: response regulator transcription factor [Ruminococcus sp.]|nr:response regulator transcription factor [Ruminococcus sp.]
MIYMLEDDSGIRSFVIYALRSSGFEAEGFEAPSEFWNAAAAQLPELVLLDLMLPEEDGLSVLEKLRNAPETRDIPVMILTAKGTEADKVTGLDSGADDYLVKPFGVNELISRVKALLRRVRVPAEKPDGDITVGRLTVYPERREVVADGEAVVLTMKEFDLLLLMLKSRGRVLSREELLHEVWGFDFRGESRTIDVHIRTLRSKLGSCGEMIKTIRGIGYRIGDSDD